MTKKMDKISKGFKNKVLDEPSLFFVQQRILKLSKSGKYSQQELLNKFFQEVYRITNSQHKANHARNSFEKILLRGGRRKPLPVFGTFTQGGAVNPR
jgi:hypothetical protein